MTEADTWLAAAAEADAAGEAARSKAARFDDAELRYTYERVAGAMSLLAAKFVTAALRAAGDAVAVAVERAKCKTCNGAGRRTMNGRIVVCGVCGGTRCAVTVSAP